MLSAKERQKASLLVQFCKRLKQVNESEVLVIQIMVHYYVLGWPSCPVKILVIDWSKGQFTARCGGKIDFSPSPPLSLSEDRATVGVWRYRADGDGLGDGGRMRYRGPGEGSSDGEYTFGRTRGR